MSRPLLNTLFISIKGRLRWPVQLSPERLGCELYHLLWISFTNIRNRVNENVDKDAHDDTFLQVAGF